MGKVLKPAGQSQMPSTSFFRTYGKLHILSKLQQSQSALGITLALSLVCFGVDYLFYHGKGDVTGKK